MIHQYKFNNYNIIVDANSASVHSVDEVAYDIIAKVDEVIRRGDRTAAEVLNDEEIRRTVSEEILAAYEVPAEDTYEVMDDLADLVADNLLWSEDLFEAAASDLKIKQSVLKAICLHVAHGCNMDCEYCFAGKGDYSGKSGIMSLEVGKRALDYLVENSGSRRHLEVDFFGGEPLINWDVCKELVRYGRELEKKHNKIFNFTLTTNGVLIDDDVIDFTNREMGNVVLSMDGRRETHDRMRHTKSGDGTYDSIMDNFKALVASRTEPGAERRSSEYYMRGTYTAYNKDFSRDVLAMADMGFKETSIEPVVSDPSVPYALHKEDLPQLFEEYEKLAMEMYDREMRGEGFNFYHYTVDLTGGPCIYKRVSGCGVATEYLAVTPTGDLYPCHQFVGDDDMIVGNIYEGITHPETVGIFSGGNNLYTRNACKDCWVKLYCAGGCAANNYHSNGDINKVYEFGCELQRKRIECALMLAVAKNEKQAGCE
ncbi:MAG: thioether cross-link-forming SCIFF peptide maturase [Mogibacterium sp.]|nr:thioether cross-link-forming SCIFF peptide maturase [Mogibacterium sp.]